MDPQQQIDISKLYANHQLGLQEFLNKGRFERLSTAIKSNMNDFINYLQINNRAFRDLVDLGIKTSQFKSTEDKRLSSFCSDVLSGDFGSVSQLFIKETAQSANKQATEEVPEDPMKKDSENSMKDQSQQILQKQQFLQKYGNLLYLFEYLRRPILEIQPISLNYLNRLLMNLTQNRPYDIYLFHKNQALLLPELSDQQIFYKPNEMQQQSRRRPILQIMIKFIHKFPSFSQMLGKMMAEEGEANKFIEIKKEIVDHVVKQLMSDELIEENTDNYERLLDFVSYVFMRNKFRSQDQPSQLATVTQRFVDEDVLWYFKQKLIRSVLDVNSSANTSNNAIKVSNPKQLQVNSEKSLKTHLPKMLSCQQLPRLASQTDTLIERKHKYSFEEKQLEQFQRFDENMEKSIIAYENSLSYLLLVVDRLNNDEEFDPYMSMSNSVTKSEPTMDFHVDEVLYSENSLYEFMTLNIPFKYTALQKMRYYQFLLALTRNSRYTGSMKVYGLRESYKNLENQMQQQANLRENCLRRNSLLSILIHLLKQFRRQLNIMKPNKWLNKKKKKQTPRPSASMVKFYLQQIITEAILPRIEQLETKQIMMVISVLNPSEQMFSSMTLEEDKAYIYKILLIIETKCEEWFSKHFKNISVDLEAIKIRFNKKLCGNCFALKDRKSKVKEFQYIPKYIDVNEVEVDKKQSKEHGQYGGDWSSSSSSDDMKEFDVKREFEFPEQEQSEIKWISQEKQAIEQTIINMPAAESRQELRSFNRKQESQLLLQSIEKSPAQLQALSASSQAASSQAQVHNENEIKRESETNQDPLHKI